jgi:hypothetical protein
MSRIKFLIAPEESAYHTKLELLSNTIVKLQQHQEENNEKIEQIMSLLKYTPEYKISQFEKGNISLLKKIIDDLKKQLSIKDETHTREQLKIEESLNKLEADNKQIHNKNSSLCELNDGLFKKIKLIEQKNVMMCEINVNLVKKVDAQIKEQLKTEERLNKLEEIDTIKKGRLKDLDNITRLEKEQKQTNILLMDRIYELEKQVRITEKDKIKTEDRLNKLEHDNKELRKIIDELRPTPSKYM